MKIEKEGELMEEVERVLPYTSRVELINEKTFILGFEEYEIREKALKEINEKSLFGFTAKCLRSGKKTNEYYHCREYTKVYN